jgi:uncharacterized protein YcaQ
VSSIRLSLTDAPRLAVDAALLPAPRPRSILEVVEHLGGLQIDPTSATARAEHLVLWSRLGSYDVSELDRLRWGERRLFEYRAFILPASDFGIHREVLRRYPQGESARARYVREWLAANAAFRSRDLQDRSAAGWQTGGWNDNGRNVSMMLETLARRGEIAIAGRSGNERLWDLAERRLPLAEPRLPQREVARRLLDRQLRWCGLARQDAFGFSFSVSPPGRDRALRREGRFRPATVDGLSGEWLVHEEALGRHFRPRTTLLCPFDKLIAHRQFTEEVFGFRYRLEIYIPKAKREFGYYVLPILHGERLIGRVDPLFDRKTGVLRVNAVYAEPDAPADAGEAVARAIRELAKWLGAAEISVGANPRPWTRALASLTK